MAENPSAPASHESFAGPECPHCEYSLEGLQRGTAVCPECGGSLSARAFAMAAVRRVQRSLAARLVLLVSPAVGLIGGVGAWLMRRAFHDYLTFLFLCLWVAGTVAVYFSARKGRRRLGKAVLIGLPVGIVYFVLVVGIALGIVALIAWLR